MWIRVAAVSEVTPGTGRELVCEGRIIALFNVEGEFHALDGLCPHQGGPLGKGRLTGSVVTCPWHGFQFDVRTGQHQASPSLCQPALEVKIEAGEVYVNLVREPGP